MGGRSWTPAEDAFLRAHYAHAVTTDLARQLGRGHKATLNRANDMGLRKSVETITLIARERNRQRNEAGLANAGHFTPGHATWNKGMDYKAGGRSVETQFQPGDKPWTWKPIGSLRIVDGQLQRKVNDNPGNNTDRWKPVSRLVWEAANGPVPPGHLVVFRPGCSTTNPALITLDTVELITRAEHARRNSWTRLPPELREITRLRATLTRFTNQRAKEEMARTPSANTATNPATTTSNP